MQTHTQFFQWRLLMTFSLPLPNLLASDPCAEDITTAIENDEVRICTGSESAFPILDPEAPSRVERGAFYRFAKRTARET
jgi:hypothetical protein